MDVDLVALLGFPFALDRKGDINLQIIRGQNANGSRGEQREREQDALHFEKGGTVSRDLVGEWVWAPQLQHTKTNLRLPKVPGNCRTHGRKVYGRVVWWWM